MTTESLALDFKSATLYAIRVVLHSANLAQLTEALDKRMHDAGSFFENEPVVIDASRVSEPLDWPALIEALQGHNLPVIGVVAEDANLEAARAAGLTPVELSALPQRAPQAVDPAPPNHVATPVPAAPEASPAAQQQLRGTSDADSSAEAVPARAARETTAAASPTPAGPQSSSALVITRPLRWDSASMRAIRIWSWSGW